MDENDLTEAMNQWRRGELSNGEILGRLLNAQAEIWMAIAQAENKTADELWARIGVGPSERR